jgi:type II secretory ATPase GspE/PulE/Tfp pilus assembly ATPase PilB-like protein
LRNRPHESAPVSAAVSTSPGAFFDRLDTISHDIPAVVDALLADACARGAGDVHLTPSPAGLVVRYRLDGVLSEIGVMPPLMAAPVVARLKVLCGLLTYRTDIPQEGRIVPDSTAHGEIRVSTFPTLHGERAALRFISVAEVRQELDRLGLQEDVLAALKRSIAGVSGLVVVTGPAGSGKTTTLYSCLRAIADDPLLTRAVVTLEDPIERALEGVSQTSVDRRDGGSLAKLVKAVLRQDPDVIAVGEIRDRATARAAFQAALTGHLVLTTTHAGDAVEVLTRMSDMAIAPYVLRSGLRAVLAQRLLRKLCTHCRVERSRENCGEGDFGLGLEQWHAAAPGGCPACRQTGYVGRTVVAEWLEPGADEVGRALTARIDASKLRRLRALTGALTLLDNARALVGAGVTSPLEVRRVLGV